MVAGLITTASVTFIYLMFRWASDGCEPHTTKADFDVTKYMGLWYEFARSIDMPFESGECVTAQYSLDGERTVKVINTQYLATTESLDSVEGTAYCSKF